jgi:two-component system sensor histidine kinase RegB
VLTILSLLLLNYFYLELPGLVNFNFPDYYTSGIVVAIIIGLIFLSYFGIKFTGESKKRSSALDKLQEVMAKEYELESLDGLAAAAAHSLGTPLATISVVVKELKKEMASDTKYAKDLDLLISQTKRCSDILEQISKKEIREDKFINKIKVENLLDELINSFVGTTEKDINLINKEDKNSISIIRTPELVYGIKNFIDNAVKFANSLVEVHLLSSYLLY